MADHAVTYLHGDLELHIIGARDLPNMDFISSRLRRFVTSCGACNSRTAVSTADHHWEGSKTKGNIISSDPYVTVRILNVTVARTRMVKNTREPKWDQHFLIQLAHPVVDLEFQVKDNNTMGAELIGAAKIPASCISTGRTVSGWFPLITGKPRTAIQLEMKFTWVGLNSLYKHGIGGDPSKKGVRGTYFPLRKGSSLTLYQDAHVPDDGVLPRIQVEGGVYEHPKCWEDICYAISESHHLIYVVGWSVFYKVKLIREPTRPLPRGGNLTLGELLKYKSEEGVRVLLLVWDDKTSHSKYFINTEGVMHTHDEETRKFFKHSSVNCVLAPRYGSNKLGYIKQQVVGTMFTHHQKCVMVDTQGPGNNRKITAFIGGIDLCDGRYDTPEHRLFQDLNTTFRDDFHNPTFLAGVKAPREPWHDLHCKIEGPAAYDVLLNFEQRWRKATKWREFSLFVKGKAHWHDDALIQIERISWILNPTTGGARLEDPNNKASLLKLGGNHHHHHHHRHHHHHITTVPKDNPVLYVSDEDDPNNWHVQIFRSIDSGSIKGFPKKGEFGNDKINMESIATSQNLLYTKNVVVDRSIQTAYIQAIRSAQHFIYIENQYFIGSSYGWPSYKNAGADNLIPMELALKIAGKISAKERFAVYIVIPMWPEGDPKTGTVQEILYWQYQTMQMMYDIVARELRKEGIENSHPQDYLNFYCLGKREKIQGDDPVVSNDNNSTSNRGKVSESYNCRRFMIYVHAKGMIVDDEYVLIGSANINQRSLAGTKDTEIAMGAYQPHHTWENKKRHPHGQVYGYRMSLWAEHLASVKRVFEEPKSLECVREVNKIAESNWKNYSCDCFQMLQGHLLKYPLQVDKDGKVSSLPQSENFPDVGGKVIGAHSTAIPDILTT